MALWKINCMEDQYPGMWHRWYRHQCVAVGWYGKWGFPLEGPTDNRGWARARTSLAQMAVGDLVIVALRDHRVGRLGEITAKHVGDEDWEPLVPPSKREPAGEMGRRIDVRWDMTCGPDDRDLVVLLPEEDRFTSGELRPTIARIRSRTAAQIRKAMNDEANWVPLASRFEYEKALSDYIATYPHRLEDGLVPHPDEKVRERVFEDRSRLDVLLLDREARPVVVECKRGGPTAQDLDQLRHYMKRLRYETGQDDVRGILVHGGARKLRPEVTASAAKAPPVEVVQHQLHVNFVVSGKG
jgi:hypothetical protein